MIPLPLLPGASVPFTLQGPSVQSSDFRVTTFASNLPFPKGMQEVAKNQYLIAVSVPNSASSGFYSSSGQIWYASDLDGDGVADSTPKPIFTGLPGSLSGFRVLGDLAFVFSSGREIVALRLDSNPTNAPTRLGSMVFSLPSNWLHPPSNLILRHSPTNSSAVDVIFQLGSSANFAVSTKTVPFKGNGQILGLDTSLAGDAIHLVTLIDQGSSLLASPPVQLATGLRNPAGFAFHPTTQDLWFQDNGIDGVVDANEPTSADEINILPLSDFGKSPVSDYGFPSNYVEYRTQRVVGGGGIVPWVAFQPLPNPTNGSEAEGASDIEFAPPGFPDYLNQGLFVGFHGKFVLGGIANEENPLVYIPLSSREYFHFIGNDEPEVGHLDSLMTTRDSLFVLDFSRNGGIGASSAAQGFIYQLKSLTPPRLTVSIESGQLRLEWSHGELQESNSPTGPFVTSLRQANPSLIPFSSQQMFFRVFNP